MSSPAELSAAAPMLAIKGAADAIEFYKMAFGARELFRLTYSDGKIAHAEIEIGKALVMLSEEDLRYNTSPMTLGGTSVILHLVVPDVDALFAAALAAGAREIFPVRDQFYGDRSGRLQDPFGHMWIVATRKEEVSPEEMQRRLDAMMAES